MSASLRPQNREDFFAGLIFLAFGVFGLIAGWEYESGTISRMGPGYLPALLSIGLSLIGILVAAKAMRSGQSRIEKCRIRPIAFIFAAILAFAFLINRGGLVVSTFMVTALSSFASRQARWAEAIVAGALIAALTVAVFIYLLGLPLSVWPR